MRSPITLLILLLLSLPLYAVEAPDGVTVVTAPEVKRMHENGEALLINVLSAIEYNNQHIAGSINIPVDSLATSPLFPTDKQQAIIFYCNGVNCPFSVKASRYAVAQGYQKVYWFRGGILEWRKYQFPMEVNEAIMKVRVSKLSPDKFQALAKGDTIVLDVRPQWWRKSAETSPVIEGTDLMIPLLHLDQMLNAIPKDKPLLIADRLMRQSLHAAKFLIIKGFDVQGVLMGGAYRWDQEGFPVLLPEQEPAFSLPTSQ